MALTCDEITSLTATDPANRMTPDKRISEIVERRMREVSAQSAACKRDGDETRMYQLNVAWHWLDAVRRDILALSE